MRQQQSVSHYLKFAQFLWENQYYKHATGVFEKSFDIDPKNPEILTHLAKSLENMNRLDEAERYIRQGLRFAPDDPQLNFFAAKLERRRGKLNTAIERLHRLTLNTLAPKLVQKIYFELGCLYDQIQDSEKAFLNFKKGNQLAEIKAEKGAITKEISIQKYNLMLNYINRQSARAWPENDAQSTSRHFFLIGFPRSGTTLLEMVLDTHPQIKTAEETRAVFGIESYLSSLPDGFPDALDKLTTEDIRKIRREYFKIIRKKIQLNPDHILVDKLPLNTLNIPHIMRIFPNARFIFAVRHPCDVCLSCFMQNFRLNSYMAHFFTLADSVDFYVKIMEIWQKCVDVLSPDFYLIKYENLVCNFENEVQDLFNYIGIEWNNSALRFFEHAHTREKIKTPSYQQVTRPIYREAIFRWHRYKIYLKPYMDILKPFIEYWKYPGE